MTATYVVVERSGQDDEVQVSGDFASIRAAADWLRSLYTTDELETLAVSIMKRLPDGSLTTEF